MDRQLTNGTYPEKCELPYLRCIKAWECTIIDRVLKEHKDLGVNILDH